MMKRITALLFSAISLCLIGCDVEEDGEYNDTLYATLTCPEGFYLTDRFYKIQISATDFEDKLISNIKLVGYNAQVGEFLLIDTVPKYPTKSVNIEYPFQPPILPKDTTGVELKMTVLNSKGDNFVCSKFIRVVKADKELKQVSGVIMYAFDDAANNRPAAYNLAEGLKSVGVDAEEKIDLYSEEIPSSDSPSGMWKTKTGLKFAKNNSFDFSKATRNSLVNTYSASKKDEYVNNIQHGDIILVGTEKEAKAVILIRDVIDKSGTMDDYYLFDIKLIE